VLVIQEGIQRNWVSDLQTGAMGMLFRLFAPIEREQMSLRTTQEPGEPS
jgi:hypothetical protein